jgi:hypothetical protein
MFNTLPPTAAEFADWSWEQIAPYYEELEKRPLTADYRRSMAGRLVPPGQTDGRVPVPPQGSQHH